MRYWLTYYYDDDGNLILQRVESETRPVDVGVLNGGFEEPHQALRLMHFYCTFDDKTGLTDLNKKRLHRSMTWLDRWQMAYAIEPRFIFVMLGAYGFGLLALVLMALHLAAG